MSTDDRQERRFAELCATDQQVRAAIPLADVSAAIHQPDLSLHQIVATVMTGYADRPALAARAWDVTADPVTGRAGSRLLPRYDTISYRELWDRAGAVAADWYHDPHTPLRGNEFVCTLGFTSPDYMTIDLACVRLGAVTVPLQHSASVDHLAPIVAEVEPRLLATSLEQLPIAVDCALASTTVRRVVVFDYHPEIDDHREALETARLRLTESGRPITLTTLAAALERDRTLPPAPVPTPGDDQLALIIYTSGSTGTPKGAMFSQRRVASMWLGGMIPVVAGQPSLNINYMPMSHVAGRGTLTATLSTGGTCYFTARSDLSTLFEDIELARPTEMLLVPRICDMVFERYHSELNRRAVNGADRAVVAAQVRGEVREKLLGGRVASFTTGSAPLSAELADFLESCLDLPIHDGYGSTEAGAILFDRKLARPPVLDYKLVDVPELGYFGTDAPYPRGELLIKSQTLMPGYFKRPDVTAEVFDADGYYRTGDIMAQIGPDELVYVDRSKNVLKLSQGEFVAVSRLEALFVTSPLVRQIFVYGNSERAYLLAVVVPTGDALRHVAGDLGQLRALLHDSLRQVAKEAGLNSYEIPRELVIETEPFSTANGLLSEIRKNLRPRLTERYGRRLEQLYTEIAERETEELRALRTVGTDQSMIDIVLRVADTVLGASGVARPDSHFTDLGGDSLSALSFSNLLKEVVGVEVPVGVIVSPANDLQRLSGHVEAALRPGVARPTFDTVHGADSTQARASDLTLDKFIDATTLDAASGLPAVSGRAHTVLLTGANGYLGRFLCLEWLERLAERGGTLVCVVRGSDAAAARKRLDMAFDSGDPDLLDHYRELAAEHLEVLAGDIGEPDLGLDESTWRRLADTVDLIVHPAALVNHVLPYQQLFGPNVVGTAELIRMALTSRIKPVAYLSTAAVLDAHTSVIDEDSDIRQTSPVRELDQGYASGYATSKWAGEVLLREASDAYGLPVAVFRSDMILAHSRFAGQLNVTDMFTRLLFTLITTGIAPSSFYRANAGGDRPRAHYDGLPADFTSEAITTLTEQNNSGYRTFNVLNPHDDGISLDLFVDWLVEAGNPITRIEDYQEWLRRTETALHALPERQKQQSLLPLLHAYAHPGEGNVSGIPVDRFRAAVRANKVGPDQDIPHITKELILKYVADLRTLRLI
nr:carboxylic acid reductase [Kibdelosporangium sp. MJ126-NF4]CEL17156.1 substrate--CoA ligase, putative [Kibdelosporangium sp. MJ126-NF4]CTQ91615.1 substrate--CoA ligase, putative [Kibdelosporangium sp. MJ126-NF4]